MSTVDSNLFITDDEDLWTVDDNILKGLWVPDYSLIPGRIVYVCANKQNYSQCKTKATYFEVSIRDNVFYETTTRQFTFINNRRERKETKLKQVIFTAKNKDTIFNESSKRQFMFIATKRVQQIDETINKPTIFVAQKKDNTF
jgi:hypothetical protein